MKGFLKPQCISKAAHRYCATFFSFFLLGLRFCLS